MEIRYDIRPGDGGKGWTVFEVSTGKPVLFDGQPQVDLLECEARNLVELLEALHARHGSRRGARVHPLPKSNQRCGT